MRMFLTGGTGLVGKRLVPRLVDRGDDVVLLTRDRQRAEAQGFRGPRISIVKGDPAFAGVWRESLAGCDGVVNLAGEPIFGRRWTEEQKARIRQSRAMSTANVVAAIGLAPAAARPKVLVSASATGYYGPQSDDRRLTEEAHPGSDFLANVCTAWEEAARSATAHGTRVVVLRLGVVLDPEGGALARMIGPFRMFVGGPIGDGNQWFSWIHVDDVVGLILLALDNPAVRGPMNATAPSPVRAKEFAKELGAALHRPSWISTPRFALRLLFGEVADVLAAGQRVVPAVAERHEYLFHYPAVRAALEAILAPAGG